MHFLIIKLTALFKTIVLGLIYVLKSTHWLYFTESMFIFSYVIMSLQNVQSNAIASIQSHQLYSFF